MKTLKTLAIITLAASLSLVPVGSAWAHRSHHHHRHHDGGAIAGAAIGGTALGLVLGSAMSQPKQQAPPQVVVVQPPASDTNSQDQEVALELERERVKNLELQEEIERLKAEREGAE